MKEQHITVAMLRSLYHLSKEKSLTRVGLILSITRQTVMRHIEELEQIVGQKLVVREQQAFSLTPQAENMLADIEAILHRLETWKQSSDLRVKTENGLVTKSFLDEEGRQYLAQQHPTSFIVEMKNRLFAEMLKAWGISAGRIEDPAFDDLRDHLVLLRKNGNDWLFAAIGHESTYAKWFGWGWSKSAIGRSIGHDDVGEGYNAFTSTDYDEVLQSGSVRVDDIRGHLPDKEGTTQPVLFRRMLLGCSFPEGDHGLAVLAAVVSDIRIDGLDELEV